MARIRTIHGFLLALGAVFLVVGDAPTQAKTPYDGPWAVTIMTEKGGCDAAYRYAVMVTGGKVVSDARESTGTVNISGKIDAEGNVSVNVWRGQQHAAGTGKLSEASGAGTWTGKSSSANCTGRWEARRNTQR